MNKTELIAAMSKTCGLSKKDCEAALTAFVTAVCFMLSLFLAPLFQSIPTVATAPTLILVGVMMIGDLVKIDFNQYLIAVPCFVCIVIMPFTNSISDGILMGLITWVMLHLLTGHARNLSVGTCVLAIFFLLKYLLF